MKTHIGNSDLFELNYSKNPHKTFTNIISLYRKVSIVPNLSISDKARERMETTAKELIEERNAAIEVCGDWLLPANL